MNHVSARARRQLHALARSMGVEVRWHAQDGSTQTCSDDTLIAVLQLLRVDIQRPDDAIRARADLRREQREMIVDPAVVAWDGAPPVLQVRLPAATATEFAVVVRTESGEERRWLSRDLSVRITAGDDDNACHTVALPQGFEPGRHRLRVEAAARHASATIIAAPSRLPGVDARTWGIFAPVYALHEHADSAPGDLATLDALGRWLQPHGGTVIGTLPILAMFVGHGKEPCDPSPYAPVSRRYWNELYLDLHAVTELDGSTEATVRAPGRMLDLPAVAAVRRPLLDAAADRLRALPVRRAEHERWLAAHPDARDYAEFRAATEGSGREGVATHEYAQWLMANQLDNLAGNLASRAQSLYIDLPVGAHRDGYDVAARPDLFAGDASVGAPPDDFQRDGQNWGFPPVDPRASRADAHGYLAACLDEQLQYAKLLRLDHVMGLHRLWMIPAGASAVDGAYVHYAAEEHWATISLAAGRHGATIVGENLGTVPAETNRAMRRHRALGMWVAEFEIPDEQVTVDRPGPGVLACIDTHDLPTFAKWWADLDAPRRRTLLATLHASGELDHARPDDPASPAPAAVLAAILAWLGHSRSPLVLAALEDLWLEPNPQNVPGAGHQHEAFRQRAAHGLDELDTLASVTHALDRLDLARRTPV